MSGLIAEVCLMASLPAPAEARAIRERAGVSQARLAAELGVHPITVCHWERGASRPTTRGGVRQAYAQLLSDLDAAVRTVGQESAA
jgi:DNA-binding XRE family transcriptional regulator